MLRLNFEFKSHSYVLSCLPEYISIRNSRHFALVNGFCAFDELRNPTASQPRIRSEPTLELSFKVNGNFLSPMNVHWLFYIQQQYWCMLESSVWIGVKSNLFPFIEGQAHFCIFAHLACRSVENLISRWRVMSSLDTSTTNIDPSILFTCRLVMGCCKASRVQYLGHNQFWS